MKLCVSCKGCRRECPTGVDMAKMKIEVLAAANKRRGLSLHDRLVAYLPRYAPYAARLAPLHECPQRHPRPRRADRAPHRLLRQTPAAALAPRSCSTIVAVGSGPLPSRGGVGVGANEETLAAHPTPKPLPVKGRVNAVTRSSCRRARSRCSPIRSTRYFEPENLHDAVEVLTRLGYRVSSAPRSRTKHGRCAAGARSCRPAWSMRRAPRRGGCCGRRAVSRTRHARHRRWSPPAC